MEYLGAIVVVGLLVLGVMWRALTPPQRPVYRPSREELVEYERQAARMLYPHHYRNEG